MVTSTGRNAGAPFHEAGVTRLPRSSGLEHWTEQSASLQRFWPVAVSR